MLFVFKLSLWVSLLFSCRAHDPEISDKINNSVEFQESKGNYFVRDNGKCTGLMQIDSRYVSIPRTLLRVPVVNRVVGLRALKYWKKRANGNMELALASYNCGNDGLKGLCGTRYAKTVLGRNIKIKNFDLPRCWMITGLINSYLDNRDYLYLSKYAKRYSVFLKESHEKY